MNISPRFNPGPGCRDAVFHAVPPPGGLKKKGLVMHIVERDQRRLSEIEKKLDEITENMFRIRQHVKELLAEKAAIQGDGK